MQAPSLQYLPNTFTPRSGPNMASWEERVGAGAWNRGKVPLFGLCQSFQALPEPQGPMPSQCHMKTLEMGRRSVDKTKPQTSCQKV